MPRVELESLDQVIDRVRGTMPNVKIDVPLDAVMLVCMLANTTAVYDERGPRALSPTVRQYLKDSGAAIQKQVGAFIGNAHNTDALLAKATEVARIIERMIEEQRAGPAPGQTRQ